jgi:hypothetical protein
MKQEPKKKKSEVGNNSEKKQNKNQLQAKAKQSKI